LVGFIVLKKGAQLIFCFFPGGIFMGEKGFSFFLAPTPKGGPKGSGGGKIFFLHKGGKNPQKKF